MSCVFERLAASDTSPLLANALGAQTECQPLEHLFHLSTGRHILRAQTLNHMLQFDETLLTDSHSETQRLRSAFPSIIIRAGVVFVEHNDPRSSAGRYLFVFVACQDGQMTRLTFPFNLTSTAYLLGTHPHSSSRRCLISQSIWLFSFKIIHPTLACLVLGNNDVHLLCWKKSQHHSSIPLSFGCRRESTTRETKTDAQFTILAIEARRALDPLYFQLFILCADGRLLVWQVLNPTQKSSTAPTTHLLVSVQVSPKKWTPALLGYLSLSAAPSSVRECLVVWLQAPFADMDPRHEGQNHPLASELGAFCFVALRARNNKLSAKASPLFSGTSSFAETDSLCAHCPGLELQKAEMNVSRLNLNNSLQTWWSHSSRQRCRLCCPVFLSFSTPQSTVSAEIAGDGSVGDDDLPVLQKEA